MSSLEQLYAEGYKLQKAFGGAKKVNSRVFKLLKKIDARDAFGVKYIILESYVAHNRPIPTIIEEDLFTKIGYSRSFHDKALAFIAGLQGMKITDEIILSKFNN